MNDLISRQVAIDDLHGKDPSQIWDTADIEVWVNALPSVQTNPCDDAVSRQRLLNDLKELIAAWKKYPVMAEQIKGVETAIGYVETIPSVTPERKKGKWINNIHDLPICDQCGYMTPYDRVIDDYEYGNFCPNCGADMRGDI